MTVTKDQAQMLATLAAARCQWCGVFVAKATQPTSWRVRVGKPARQNPRSPWNYWARLLCPSCSRSASRHLTFWQPVTRAEVDRRRARGWPEVVRRCQ